MKRQKDGFKINEIRQKMDKVYADDARIFAEHGQPGQYLIAGIMPSLFGKMTTKEIENITVDDVKALKKLKDIKGPGERSRHQWWAPFYFARSVVDQVYPGSLFNIGTGRKFDTAAVVNSEQAYALYEDTVKHYFSILIGRTIV